MVLHDFGSLDIYSHDDTDYYFPTSFHPQNRNRESHFSPRTGVSIIFDFLLAKADTVELRSRRLGLNGEVVCQSPLALIRKWGNIRCDIYHFISLYLSDVDTCSPVLEPRKFIYTWHNKARSWPIDDVTAG
jgi:hypothetical protein